MVTGDLYENWIIIHQSVLLSNYCYIHFFILPSFKAYSKIFFLFNQPSFFIYIIHIYSAYVAKETWQPDLPYYWIKY